MIQFNHKTDFHYYFDYSCCVGIDATDSEHYFLVFWISYLNKFLKLKSFKFSFTYKTETFLLLVLSAWYWNGRGSVGTGYLLECLLVMLFKVVKKVFFSLVGEADKIINGCRLRFLFH